MTPLLRVLALWRPRVGILSAGLLLSLLALACGIAMLTLSGSITVAMLAGTLVGAGLWLQVLGPARVMLRYAERLVTHGGTFRALADLRVWFFRGLASRTAGGLGFRQAGDVLQRLVGDVENLDGLYLRIILPLAGAALIVPTVALVAGQISAASFIAVSLLFATAAFILPAIAARAAAGVGKRLAQASAGLRIAALDTLTGLREVRAFGAEPRMIALVASREAELIAAQRSLATRTAWANTASLLCGQAAILTVLFAAGSTPILSIIACFLLVAAYEPISALPRAGVAAGSAAASATRVLAIGAARPESDDAAPIRPPTDNGLRFAAVRFAWQAGQPPVFDGLTLDLPAGTRAAVLGPSGVGKSTLAALALKVAVPPGRPRAAGRHRRCKHPRRRHAPPHRLARSDDASVRRHHPRQPAARPAGRHRTRAVGRAGTAQQSATWCVRCPTASIPGSARAAQSFLAAKEGVWPLPALCCSTPRCSSWTNPAPAWMPKPNALF